MEHDCGYYFEKIMCGEYRLVEEYEIADGINVLADRIRGLQKQMERPCDEWFSIERYMDISKEIEELKRKIKEMLVIAQASALVQTKLDDLANSAFIINGFSIKQWAERVGCYFDDINGGIEFPPDIDFI